MIFGTKRNHYCTAVRHSVIRRPSPPILRIHGSRTWLLATIVCLLGTVAVPPRGQLWITHVPQRHVLGLVAGGRLETLTHVVQTGKCRNRTIPVGHARSRWTAAPHRLEQIGPEVSERALASVDGEKDQEEKNSARRGETGRPRRCRQPFWRCEKVDTGTPWPAHPLRPADQSSADRLAINRAASRVGHTFATLG